MSENSKDEILNNTDDEAQSDAKNISEDNNEAFDAGMLTENSDESLIESSDDTDNTPDDIKADDSDDIKSYDETVLSDIGGRISSLYLKYKNTEPKKKRKMTVLFSIALVLALLILTDLIPILPNAYNRFYVGNSYTIGETQSGVYDKFGEDIIYAGNGTVKSFGADMDIKLDIKSPIGSPYMETSNDNAVIYYHDLNEAVVIRNAENIKNITMDNAVTAAAINANGYYGFVTDEPGYESCVSIFDNSDKSIYKWHTNNHIIDISISDNAHNMTAVSYDDKAHISGKLIFLSMYKDTPVKELVTDGNLISEIKFINNDTVVAFGDLYTAAYTPEGVMKWRIDYEGRTLKNYDININGEIGFVFDRYSSQLSESVVEIYSADGGLRGKFESEDNIKYISANNDYYLLSLDGETILLNKRAKIKKRKPTVKEYRRAVLYENYNFAFSISDSVAEILSVRH